jgi:hypothetical protein
VEYQLGTDEYFKSVIAQAMDIHFDSIESTGESVNYTAEELASYEPELNWKGDATITIFLSYSRPNEYIFVGSSIPEGKVVFMKTAPIEE